MIKIDVSEKHIPETNLGADEHLSLQAVGEQDFFKPDNTVRQKNRVLDIVAYAGKALDEVEANEEAAKADAKEAVGSPTQKAINRQEDINGVEAAFEKERDFNQLDDFVIEGALSADDPRYSPALANAITNQQIAAEMVQEKFSETLEQGLGKTVWDFVDYNIFRYIPFGMLEDIGMRQKVEGLSNVIDQASMTPDEFKEAYAAQLEQAAQEGFFTEENYFAVLNELERATNSGYAPDARLNQALGIGEAALLVAPFLKGAGALSRAAAVSGRRAADRAYRNTPDELLTEDGLSADVSLRPNDPSTAPGAPRVTESAIDQRETGNAIVRELKARTSSGVFGEAASPEQINEAARTVRGSIEARTSRPIIDHGIMDVEAGRKAAWFDFGKMHNGEAFPTKLSAQSQAKQLTDRGMSTEVIESPEGFYIRVTERLDLTRAEDVADIRQELSGLRKVYSNLLGSTAQVDIVKLNVQAQLSEAGVSSIKDIVQPYLKKVDAISFDSKAALGSVMKELRDGVDSEVRVFYTDGEFAARFREAHPKGLDPTEKDFEAYYALRTMNDAAYFMKAQKVADSFVTKGYKSIDFGDGVIPAKRVARENVTGPVYDSKTKQTVAAESLSEDVVIWRSAKLGDDVPEYIAKPSKVREIEHTDVLSYNAGGPRTNPDANLFVTLGRDTARAVLTAFTEKQAREAVTELTNIVNQIKHIRNTRGLKLADMSDELDEVISTNNKWNPSITNTADLISLAARKGWRLDAEDIKVDFKKKGDPVEGDEDIFEGMSYGEYLTIPRRRGDESLMEVGGKETFNYNPVRTITDQLSSAAHEYSWLNYTQRAKTAWVKKVLRKNDLSKESKPVNVLFEELTPKGVGASRLEQLRNVIRRREFHKGPVSKRIDSLMEDASAYVFDVSKGKIKTRLSDPTNALLKVGFQTAFGFFNVFQFFLQASHSVAIAAISPQHGSKALAMALPFRAVMQTGSEEAFRRFSKATGMSTEEVREMYTFVKTSGRYDVDLDAAESLTPQRFGVSSWEGEGMLPSQVRKGLYSTSSTAKRTLSAGLTPFREGERLSRLTGQLTAFLEYKAAFKGAKTLTPDARAWISKREHDLTLNMTTASRAWFQDGLMRLPTQWMSHTLRIMETLFVGRGMSKGERARLGLFVGASGGMAGVPIADMFIDDTTERLGVEPDSKAYTAIKYGFFDAINSWALSGLSGQEVRTAIGTRVSPWGQLVDFWRNVQSENAIATLGGPSVSITSNFVSEFAQATNHIINGRPQSASIDVQAALRSIAGLNNISKAKAIAVTGTYTTRAGQPMPFKDLTTVDALMELAGLTSMERTEYYRRKGDIFRSQKEVREISKQLKRDYQVASKMWHEGNKSKAKDLYKEIADRIEYSGLSPTDQRQVRGSLKVLWENDMNRIAQYYLQRGERYSAELVEGLDD